MSSTSLRLLRLITRPPDVGTEPNCSWLRLRGVLRHAPRATVGIGALDGQKSMLCLVNLKDTCTKVIRVTIGALASPSRLCTSMYTQTAYWRMVPVGTGRTRRQPRRGGREEEVSEEEVGAPGGEAPRAAVPSASKPSAPLEPPSGWSASCSCCLMIAGFYS